MSLEMSERSMVAPLLLAMMFQVLLSVGLYAWGRWVARRQGGGRWWRRASWMPLIGLGLAAVGAIWTSVYLVQAFRAVATSDAAQKASLLAQAISSGMNCTAFFAVLSWIWYLAGAIVFVVGSIRKPKNVSAP